MRGFSALQNPLLTSVKSVCILQATMFSNLCVFRSVEMIYGPFSIFRRGKTKVNAFFPISGSVLCWAADVLIYLRCVHCQLCPHMNVDGQLTTDLRLFTNKDLSGIVRT